MPLSGVFHGSVETKKLYRLAPKEGGGGTWTMTFLPSGTHRIESNSWFLPNMPSEVGKVNSQKEQIIGENREMTYSQKVKIREMAICMSLLKG